MSLHTDAEYRHALEVCTGIPTLTVENLPSLSEESRADIICVLQGKVELCQFRDPGDLDQLKDLLPKTLHVHQPDLQDRIGILSFVQKPVGLELLQKRNLVFAKELKERLSGMPQEVFASVREFRRRVETLVWEASDFFVAQLSRDLRSIEGE